MSLASDIVTSGENGVVGFVEDDDTVAVCVWSLFVVVLTHEISRPAGLMVTGWHCFFKIRGAAVERAGLLTVALMGIRSLNVKDSVSFAFSWVFQSA